jgi:hypothetical protein
MSMVMQVFSARVQNGAIVPDEGIELVEGTRLTVIAGEASAAFELSPADEAELTEAIAEADRGEVISATELLRSDAPNAPQEELTGALALMAVQPGCGVGGRGLLARAMRLGPDAARTTGPRPTCRGPSGIAALAAFPTFPYLPYCSMRSA